MLKVLQRLHDMVAMDTGGGGALGRSALETIADSCNGDIRCAVNTLEFYWNRGN